jgi:hypothetical protein
MLSGHFKPRYSLSVYPGAALLVGWWADAHGARRTRLGRATGWFAAAAFAMLALTLYVPSWWHPTMRPYLTGPAWEVIPAVVGLVAIGGAACWGLQSGRPRVLVGGVAVATAATLAYGIWPYTERYNRRWNYPALAATVEQYAMGGEVAVFSYKPQWMALDFYLGRPVRSLESITELTVHVARADHPVAVVEARDWRAMRASIPSSVRVLSRVSVGRDDFLLVREAPATDPSVSSAPRAAP